MQQLTTLSLDQLQPNPFQPRDKIKREEILDLANSIRRHGILEPLVIAQTPAGYQIIAGERRWRAAKEIGLTEVPVIIRKTDPKGMLEMALVENVQRDDLDAIERARAFFQLKRDFKLSTQDIADRVSKSQPYVTNSLRLLDLPDAVKDGLVGGLITEGHARALGGLEDEKKIIECYKLILKENASVRRAEDLVRLIKDSKKAERAGKGDTKLVPPEVVEQWQQQMQSHMHSKSKLTLVRSNRQTKVSIYLKGSLEQTQQDFEKIIQLVTEQNAE